MCPNLHIFFLEIHKGSWSCTTGLFIGHQALRHGDMHVPNKRYAGWGAHQQGFKGEQLLEQRLC